MDPGKITSTEHLPDSVVRLDIDDDHHELHRFNPLVDYDLVAMVELKDIVHGDQKETICVLVFVVFEANTPQSCVGNIKLSHNFASLGVHHHDRVLVAVKLKNTRLRSWLIDIAAV